MKHLSLELAHKHIKYSSETGSFTWRLRLAIDYPCNSTRESWNKRHSGKPVGGVEAKSGYLRMTIDSKQYYARQVAYVLMTGEQPGHIIKHKDGDKTNYKWDNLG